jgi:hypothetical protein
MKCQYSKYVYGNVIFNGDLDIYTGGALTMTLDCNGVNVFSKSVNATSGVQSIQETLVANDCTPPMTFTWEYTAYSFCIVTLENALMNYTGVTSDSAIEVDSDSSSGTSKATIVLIVFFILILCLVGAFMFNSFYTQRYMPIPSPPHEKAAFLD